MLEGKPEGRKRVGKLCLKWEDRVGKNSNSLLRIKNWRRATERSGPERAGRENLNRPRLDSGCSAIDDDDFASIVRDWRAKGKLFTPHEDIYRTYYYSACRLFRFPKNRHNNIHILVEVDAFTKFVFLRAVKNIQIKYISLIILKTFSLRTAYLKYSFRTEGVASQQKCFNCSALKITYAMYLAQWLPNKQTGK